MYDDHYGLTARPFQLTPDPRFWFETATHKKAMAYLGYGLSQGEGFIVITGDVGAGKTTLVGHLMNKVDRERLHVIKLVSTQIDAEDLLRLVAAGLEVETAGLTKSQLLTSIERGLHGMARSGRRTLLIVDEAQALPVGSLEELRMLSNFQAGGHALLQIFLLGQPEFRERLHGSDRLEQLRQRVIAMHHLDPMLAEEVEAYMVHRLTLVGWTGTPHFTPDAYAALFAGSDGVPRRLNQLAGRVMLYGAIEQLDAIDARTVRHVLADIAGDAPETARSAIAPMPAPVVAEEPQPAPVAAVLPEPAPEPAAEPAPESVVVEPEPIAPRPIFNAAPVNEPLPIRLHREPEPVVETMAVPPVESEPLDLAPSTADDRLAAIEARLEDQEAAMRRILTLLVDWVEGGTRPDMESIHTAQAG